MDVTEQCPTCEHQSENSRCGRERARATKNKDGQFFKSIICPLYQLRVRKSALVDLEFCPTCGQRIPRPEPVSGKVIIVKNASTVVPDIPTPKVRGPKKRSSGNKRPRKKGIQNGGSQTT